MATSTGLVLGATGVVVATEWYNGQGLNWRAGAAGGILALFMTGADKISPPIATGLASIMLVTVLVTPLKGPSPVQTVSNIFGTSGAKKK